MANWNMAVMAAMMSLAVALGATAQAQTPAVKPTTAQSPTAPAASTPQPWRTEIVVFDNWTVTCQDFREPKPRKICSGQMQVIRQGTQQVVLSLAIAPDDKGAMRALIATPTGIAIQPGVDFVTPGQPARKAAYETCEPSRCLATLAIDEKLAKELSAAQEIEASVVTNAGQSVKLSFPMKGFDKAWAQIVASK
jgi:invasion protein IalB